MFLRIQGRYPTKVIDRGQISPSSASRITPGQSIAGLNATFNYTLPYSSSSCCTYLCLMSFHWRFTHSSVHHRP